MEIIYNRTTTLKHFSTRGIVPASCVASLRDASGSVVASPGVTLPTASTTTTAATALSLTVASATGIGAGDHLLVTSDGVDYVCQCSRVDGLVVLLRSALPLTVDAGSTVKGLDVSVSIAALGAVAENYQLEIVSTSAGGEVEEAYYQCEVVRYPWGQPCSSMHVRQVLSQAYNDTRPEDFCQAVADRVNDKIRSYVDATGRRPHLYLGNGEQQFREAREVCIRWLLTEMGIGLMGDIVDASREFRYQFDNEMTRAVTGLRGYDSDNDGAIDDEPKRSLISIRCVR